MSASIVVAASAVQGAAAREAAADPLLDIPFTEAGDCAYECRACPRQGFHDIVESVKRNAQSAHLETCNPGECSSHACDAEVMPAGELGVLWRAVRETEDDRLRELLHQHREVAYYNSERDAVQVLGCKGSVLASIPLSPAQVALLEE